jgi:hypothetical protein
MTRVLDIRWRALGSSLLYGAVRALVATDQTDTDALLESLTKHWLRGLKR